MLKKIILVLFLFLSACQASVNANVPSDSEITKDFIEGEVVSVSENSLLIAYDNTLATVSLKDNTLSFSIGNIIKVSYDNIQETYPVTLTNPDIEQIEIGDNRLEMILKVIQELMETDPGLNSDINFIALDLTEFDFLNESQKNALCYLVESNFGYSVLFATMKDLIEQGLADPTYIPEGILITLKCEEMNASKLNFSCTKYRSGLGALFFSESKASLTNHSWTYELGGFAIS